MLDINNIYLGDCVELMKLIPDKSIDLIICDPPYGIHSISWDSVIPFNELWLAYERIIKPKGNILLFSSGIFLHKLVLSNEKLWRYDLVWKKSKSGSPLTAKYMPLKKHEYISVFGQSAAKYNPQMEVGEPYKRKWTPNKINNMKYGIDGVITNNSGTRHPSTVLDFPQKWRRQDQMHPTLKPNALLDWLIKSYSDEGDLVLDNCMGSGSTIISAINNNRNYIGIEKDEGYFEIAKNRIENNIILG